MVRAARAGKEGRAVFLLLPLTLVMMMRMVVGAVEM